MRGLLATLILATVLVPARADPDLAEPSLRQAAGAFGQALVRGNVEQLGPWLPDRGKVRMRLLCLGPEDGHFSRGQVHALLDNFLRDGSVSEFRVLSVEGSREPYAIIHARATATDRLGRPAQLELHLGFVREAGRWVLREIRETAR